MTKRTRYLICNEVSGPTVCPSVCVFGPFVCVCESVCAYVLGVRASARPWGSVGVLNRVSDCLCVLWSRCLRVYKCAWKLLCCYGFWTDTTLDQGVESSRFLPCDYILDLQESESESVSSAWLRIIMRVFSPFLCAIMCLGWLCLCVSGLCVFICLRVMDYLEWEAWQTRHFQLGF